LHKHGGGRTLKLKLNQLILMIWNNEQLPQQRMKELSVQFKRKMIDLTVTSTDSFTVILIITITA